MKLDLLLSLLRTRLLADRLLAKSTGEKSSAEEELHDAAAKLGAAGGKKGGPARAGALSAERRTEIARLGGRARHSS
jgi:hypothetical protein